jgi:class 3 adenylate cyclase
MPLIDNELTLSSAGLESYALVTLQVAHGIALHHECLRATLKACNGYEIATEGDSFKCAFANPEDAVCWSILSQVRVHIYMPT